MESIRDILSKLKDNDGGKYLKFEWQLYGYRLAQFLGDEERISLYMKLAKNENRNHLQDAWDFVKDSKANSKPRLFMWKLNQIKKEIDLSKKQD
jgi:hypothetical protein